MMETGKDGPPRPGRLRLPGQVGAGGFEASAIGFVLIGSVVAGFFVGAWLDGHFHTSFWMPTLVLVCAVGGFREMIVTANRIARESSGKRGTRGKTPTASGAAGQTGQPTAGYGAGQGDGPAQQEVAAERIRPRVFQVPAAPQPGYLRTAGEAGTVSPESTSLRRQEAAGLDADDLDVMKELLSERQPEADHQASSQ